ncbi:retrotransposon protein, putative, ty1-copia subclass [Tanacetum coccineum]
MNVLTLRSLIKKEKLNGSNFFNWYKNLRITLKCEGKLHHVDSPFPNPPVINATPEHVASYQASFVEQEKIMLKLNAYKMGEGQSVSSYVLKVKSYINKLERLGHLMPHDNKSLGELTAMLKTVEKNVPSKSVVPSLHMIIDGVDNQLDKKIKILRSDCGGEYLSQEFLDYLAKHGIVSQHTQPYTPKHNIGYALETYARILIMVPTKQVEKTPYEIWHGKALNLSDEIQEFEPQTEEPSMSYIILRDSELVVEEANPTNVVVQAPRENQENDVALVAHVLRRSCRPSHPPNRYYGYLIDLEARDLEDHEDPETYRKAMFGYESNQWIEAMNSKMQSMKDKKVCDLVDHPHGDKTVGYK